MQSGERVKGWHDIQSSRVMQHDRRPSELFEQHWIHAGRTHAGSYPERGERGGKWMLFVKAAEIDEWWEKNKAATESSLLGGSAKVATMKPNPNMAARDIRLICVYTYDLDDERDCSRVRQAPSRVRQAPSRVRQALRGLGVTRKIPYKTDADAHAGNDAQKGIRVSKRYE